MSAKTSLFFSTLLVAFTSSLLLSPPWHRAFIEGHTFTGLFGTTITLLPIISAIPFVWPFLVAGLLFGQAAELGLGWAFGVGLCGAAVRFALVRVEFASPAGVADYFAHYVVLALPTLLAVAGFYASRLVLRPNAHLIT
jgi:hypothetical protein